MIIGITGPAGAGKDTSADYIADRFSIFHVSGGDILRDMLTDAGLEPKKAALGPFGVFVRHMYGADEIAKRVVKKAEGKSNVLYSGFRSQAEAEAVHARKGILLYIDAPSTLRHVRIGERARDGDEIDPKVLDALDAQESTPGAIENENLPAVKAIADKVIMNDGTLEDLHAKLDEFCRSLLL
ncbi:MAG: nucleoside monophosphate kinase [Candidatus Saccharimonadales bacterium]